MTRHIGVRPGRRRIVAATLCFVLAAAACGGDDDDVTTPSVVASAPATANEGATDTSEAASTETSEAASTEVTAAPGTTAPAEEVETGGTLTLYDASDTQSYDPVAVTYSVPTDGIETFAVFDALIQFATDGTMVPRLAESVTTDDNVTWTIKLREGVVFSDGTPFNAEAVVFNWSRHLDEANGSRCRGIVAGLGTFVVTDLTTVTVTLSKPNAVFPQSLPGCLSVIGSPTAIQQKGAGFALEPVGAGPFILTNWTQGNEARYERNSNYWDAPKPYVDELIIKFNNDAQGRTTAFEQGEVDVIIFNVITQAAADLEKAGYQVDKAALQGYTGQMINLAIPPQDDVRVRQALSYAVDLELLNDAGSNGTAPVASEFFTEGTPWYSEGDPGQHVYDFDRAQQLIDGYIAEKGEPVTIHIVTSTNAKVWSEGLQQQWSELEGVEVTFEEVDGTEALQRNLERIATNSTWAAQAPDPDEALYEVFYTNGSRNVMNYSNPEVDSLLDQGRAIDDIAVRKPIYDRIIEILSEEVPFIGMYKSEFPVFGQEHVKGLSVFVTGMLDTADLWIDQ